MKIQHTEDFKAQSIDEKLTTLYELTANVANETIALRQTMTPINRKTQLGLIIGSSLTGSVLFQIVIFFVLGISSCH